MNSVTMEDTRLASRKKMPASTIVIILLAIGLVAVGALAWSKLGDRDKAVAQTQSQLEQSKNEMTQLQAQLTEAKAGAAAMQKQIDEAKQGATQLQNQLDQAKSGTADAQ